MDDLKALRALARALGVQVEYTDGLGQRVVPRPETLLRVCQALGAPLERLADAPNALRAERAAGKTPRLAPVLVAWDGGLAPLALGNKPVHAEVHLEEGQVIALERSSAGWRAARPLPLGYHRLRVESSGMEENATVIAAPVLAYRRPDSHRSWGVGTQLAALRSGRSRSVGDLHDLTTLADWIGELGGDLVMVLPLLPTFNTAPPEPSPYSPVSRLFWSELILDLEDGHQPTAPPALLDVTAADREVRAALAARAAPHAAEADRELQRYARFRGAQARLGRNWRDWPAPARDGTLEPEHVDPDEERFHLVAQASTREQLNALRHRLEDRGMRVGLDLAVGVHPDGYDPWSRQTLFGQGMSVGAPPDQGFPSGQDWGFPPVLPAASRLEGHRYLAASIAHQAWLAGVLRIDHVMAWTRLYWIPHGMSLDQGTYVSYPAEELFAVLTLESHRNRCEIVGENLGTVPPEIDRALPRHKIWGTYLALFQASDDPDVAPPGETDMAQVGTHDTPPFLGWIEGTDIDERLRYRLLAEDAEADVRKERARAVRRLAKRLGSRPDEPGTLLAALLEWLGRSDSPLVVPWLEDLWLEDRGVNLPGTRSSERPNWQRPMGRLLDEVFRDPQARALLRRLHQARTAGSTTLTSD